MTGMLIKQFLRAAGVVDEGAMTFVDALTAGGFSAPALVTTTGGSIEVPTEATVLSITTAKPGESFRFVLIREIAL